MLFSSQDREIRQALSRGLDEWVKSRFDDYPEERKRRGVWLKISPQDRDRQALKSFHPWITGSRAEAAKVQSIAKFQAASRRARQQP